MAQTNVASVAVPGSVSPGATKAMDALRSGDAAGRLVSGSRNENTKRLGPSTCRELTMIGMTDAWLPESEGTAEAAMPDVGDAVPPPQAATRTAAVSVRGSRMRRMP